MRRRDFIAVLGGVAIAWPWEARAQQSAMPVIGFMHTASADRFPHLVAAFHKGLNELGFAEGQNVVVEYRWAEGHYERLPEFAADLLARPVTILAATGGDQSGLAAKATANTTIPIVFEVGSDPVELGLVSSLNRPSGNLTGNTLLSAELAPKRLELLHNLMPKATKVAVLTNPAAPGVDAQERDLQRAAPAIGMKVSVLHASKDTDIAPSFAAMVDQHADVLIVQADPFFTNRRDQLVSLSNHHAIPTMYPFREFSMAGGLISYGADIADVFRQTGLYVGRILKGEKAADLPVLQPTKFDLVINLKTAKALGISVPQSLIVAADEVIE